MPKKMYNVINPITDFIARCLPDHDVQIGLILKTDHTIDLIKNYETITLEKMQESVGGLIEPVRYIQDVNYDVIVDEEGVLKEKPFNLLAFTVTGFNLFGNVLILKKGLLK